MAEDASSGRFGGAKLARGERVHSQPLFSRCPPPWLSRRRRCRVRGWSSRSPDCDRQPRHSSHAYRGEAATGLVPWDGCQRARARVYARRRRAGRELGCELRRALRRSGNALCRRSIQSTHGDLADCPSRRRRDCLVAFNVCPTRRCGSGLRAERVGIAPNFPPHREAVNLEVDQDNPGPRECST